MGRIVAVSCVKGGAGKSTIAVNLAAEYVRRKRRVLVVDADPQATAQAWAGIAGENKQPSPTVVAMNKDMANPGQLDGVSAAFDITIIDCPGRDGAVVRAALLVADLVLVPCGASPADVWALQQSLDLINEAQNVRAHMKRDKLIARVVITRKKQTSLGKNARQDLQSIGVPLLDVEISERNAYQTTMGQGRAVTNLPGKAQAVVEAVREVRALSKSVDRLLENKHGT